MLKFKFNFSSLVVVLLCACILMVFVGVACVSGASGDGSGVDSYTTNVTGVEGNDPFAEADTAGFENVSLNPHGLPFTFDQFFIPVSVTLTYSTAPRYSLTPQSVCSGHRETLSPNGMIFEASEVGTFTLHYEVRYLGPVNQTVFLTITGVGGQSASYAIPCFNSGFDLDLQVSTAEAPSYPGPEDLWSYGYGDFKNTIKETSEFTTMMVWITFGAVLVIIVCVVILYVHVLREHVRVTRIEQRGFVGG